MFNLIKMDLYRLVHSVSTWVIMGIVVILAVFCVTMTNVDIQMMQSAPQSDVLENTGEPEIGIYVYSDPEWLEQIEAGSVISAELQSGLLALLCIIFTAIFTNAEYKNGFIKNIAGQFPRRGKLVASRFVVIAIQVLFMMLAFSAVIAAAGSVLWGSKFFMGSVAALIKFLGIQYLLHVGFSALIMFFCILTRSMAFSMTAGILICTGLLFPLYFAINKTMYNLRPACNFDINQYTLDGNIAAVGIDGISDIMLRGAVVGLAFMAAAIVCSMLIMKKRDIQ